MKSRFLFFLIITIVSLQSYSQDSFQINSYPFLKSSTILPLQPASPFEPLTPAFKSDPGIALLADSNHLEKYDTTAISFKLAIRSYYSYDSGGMMIQVLRKAPDKGGNWKNYSRDTLSYVGPFVRKVVSQQWDSQLSTWKNSIKYDYFYDAQNVLNSIITSAWNADSLDWTMSERKGYTYNSSNRVTVELNQIWNSGVSSWSDVSRYTNTYSNEKLNVSLYEQWNSNLLVWENYSRTSYTWVSGLNTITLKERYLTSSSTWVNEMKTTFTYTPSVRVESSTSQLWDNGWVNSIQYQNTYTNEVLSNVLIRQWQAHLNDWRNYQQETWYLSNHEVFGIEEKPVTAILTANPVIAGSTVPVLLPGSKSGYTVTLTDMSGKCRYSMNSKAGENFSIQYDLPAGLYILRAQSAGKPSLVQKVLVID